MQHSLASPLPTQGEPITVIGAGLAGSLSAIFLAKAGYRVTLIDKADQIMTVSSKIPIHLHSGGLYLNDISSAKHCLHDSINFMKVMPFATVMHPTAFAVMTLDDIAILPSGMTQLMEEALVLYNKDHLASQLPSGESGYLEKAKQKIALEKINLDEAAMSSYKNDIANQVQEPAPFTGLLRAEYHAKAIRIIALQLYNKDNEKKAIPKAYIDHYKSKAQEQQIKKWLNMKNGFNILQSEYQQHVSEEASNMVFGPVNNFYQTYEAQKFAEYKVTAQKINTDPPIDDKEAWIKQLARISDPKQILGVVMSSERGLNMMIAAAGLTLEIKELVKQNKIKLMLNTQVMMVEHDNGNYKLTLRNLVTQPSGSESKDLPMSTSQVVNATGYRGKELDDAMGFPQAWTVDVKGAGIISLNDDSLHHIPGVFFTEAKGMAQLSTFNTKIAGINFTTLDVAGTYVKGGVVTFDEKEKIQDNQKLKQLESDIISKPSSELISRTQENIKGCARFMPILIEPGKVTAVGYVPGSLGILGKDKGARESKEVYIAREGYHAVNLAKGGGAVSTSMALVHSVVTESKKKFSNHPLKDPFPEGSYTKSIPENYRIDVKEEIEEVAILRANQMGLPPTVGLRYTK